MYTVNAELVDPRLSESGRGLTFGARINGGSRTYQDLRLTLGNREPNTEYHLQNRAEYRLSTRTKRAIRDAAIVTYESLISASS